MGDTYNTGDVTGGAVGKDITFTNTNSFNVGVHGKELTRLFSTLTEQLSPVRAEMKGKDIKMLDEQLGKFIEEAKKPKEEVNGSALAVTGEGLIEAAKTVGEIAGPLITTVGLILSFFGVPLP